MFKYTGLNVEQNVRSIFVDQISYCSELDEVVISDERKRTPDAALTDEELKTLKSVRGKLLWATSQTRPDVAFDSCFLSNQGKNATVRCLLEANKALRKLKCDDLKLAFPSLGNPRQVAVEVYGDGSHAGLPSGASQGGSTVFLSGNNRCAPIMWQ